MELNNSYEDAELSDCIMAIGCNPCEAQINDFRYHGMPNQFRVELLAEIRINAGEIEKVQQHKMFNVMYDLHCWGANSATVTITTISSATLNQQSFLTGFLVSIK